MSSSRERLLEQLARCLHGQRNQHIIQAPDVPRSDENVPGSTEHIPEEPMGNGAPIVPDDGVWPWP